MTAQSSPQVDELGLFARILEMIQNEASKHYRTEFGTWAFGSKGQVCSTANAWSAEDKHQQTTCTPKPEVIMASHQPVHQPCLMEEGGSQAQPKGVNSYR